MSSSRSEGRRFAAISLGLILFIPITWGARELSLRSVRADVETRQSVALSRAFAGIQEDFERQQTELLELARSLASDERVRTGLADWTPGARPGERLVRFLTSTDLPDRVAVEVYDPTPRLVAWSGFSMPLDDAPGRPQFLEDVSTATVRDGDQRTAITVWLPVRDGLRVVGALRMMKLLEIAVPVENQYLRSFSQARIWSSRTRLPVRFRYDAPFDDELPLDGQVRLLSGIDGAPLGRVFISRPDEQDLLRETRRVYDHVLAFWLSLVSFWLVAGLWRLYRKTSGSKRGSRTAALFLSSVIALWGLRFLLIALDVPARFQEGDSPLGPLFDPTQLASSAGWGLFRSTGDLAITSVFALLCAAMCAVHASAVIPHRPNRPPRGIGSLVDSLRSHRTWWLGALIVVVSVPLVVLFATVSKAIILDSTLEYFARTGLLPERLVLVVFAALLLLAAALVLFGATVYWWGADRLAVQGRVLDTSRAIGGVIVAGLIVMVLVVAGVLAERVPVVAVLLFVGAAAAAAVSFRVRVPVQLLTLRTVLPSVLLLTAILYPLFYSGMQAQRRMRMVDAAASFEDWRDPRVQYAVEKILTEAQEDPGWLVGLSAANDSLGRSGLDSMITEAVRNSFLTALGSYEISVTVYGEDGAPLGRFYEVDHGLGATALDQLERLDLQLLRGMYEESGFDAVLVEPLTDPQRTDRFPYYGVAPFRTAAGRVSGWMVVRAEPRVLLRETLTPFPRALVPAGFYGNLPGRLSVAVFRDGALLRSTGDDFSSYRLPDDISAELRSRGELWRTEALGDDDFYSYYQLRQSPDAIAGVPVATVIAVRARSINVFDHLYNLLRLTFGGLVVGIPIYLLGIFLRRRKGLLPAPRVRFRDKILNAFLGVGVIMIALMGVVGLNVVTGENEREIEGRLRQHLDRVERSLALEARGGEMPYRILERVRIDSLSARLGLDINVFRESELVASSRPQLVRDRLIDPRLPIKAYEALYVDGLKFTRTEEKIGSFEYTAGFRSIPDEEGRAHYVISVPTLPEQEEIEEERARTVAYLFGALLLLVMVVLGTASLLANALTRPIARLRDGIDSVARGTFNRIRQIDTRDEISELVDSFNTMQDQLGESRRRLARQERQLAWREMARQVAHEIKNPLTPMKLSVQHLRRSFEERNQEEEEAEFEGLFERITGTLTEQIDALARIANEFSTFARLPQRVEESIDVNSVVEEAVALMQAEAEFDIDLQLAEEPLIVQADREEARRIFINLIKNALQSIPEDRDGRVAITTRRDESATVPVVHATVSDNGAGIPEDVRSKIFVPNFSTKTSGAGLGLAIARKSVEDLQGKIGFDTSVGHGTTFWVRIPLDVELSVSPSGPADETLR